MGVTLPGRVDDVLLDYLDQHSKPLATAQLLDIDPDIKDSIWRFNEIPGKILDPSRWKVCLSSNLKFKEFITKSEGRALLLAYKHALRTHNALGNRIVILGNNLTLCLAVARGRSSSPSLVKVCRSICALSLATGSRIVPPMGALGAQHR